MLLSARFLLTFLFLWFKMIHEGITYEGITPLRLRKSSTAYEGITL